MSTSSITSWKQRKARMGTLLQSRGDEDADGLTLDRVLHSQSVIGKTFKTTEVDSLRFSDTDLTVVGTLEYGQFAVVDAVTCNLDGRVYIRKTIEKRFAFKTRDQCNPQLERDILLRAFRKDSVWAPHLLCAFQTATHLSLVMDYAEGGTLWDVLESSPNDGRLLEDDLRWWFPQVISAIAWCHDQGFVHRDVKPHNFVLTQTSHVQLIDFGSAAPLLPRRHSDGARLVPRKYCLVPCGTCDYISPEILQAHEAALVAMEMSDEEASQLRNDDGDGGYGVETDWWSMGAMLYEMAYGVAPFWARDIRTTYLKIVDHKRSLKFKTSVSVSDDLRDLMRRLLTDNHQRLGFGGVEDIHDHPFFRDIGWDSLHIQTRPNDLHLPQFTYAETLPVPPADRLTASSRDTSHASAHSKAFAFSMFFQPSEPTAPELSALQPTPKPNRSILREQSSSFFIGFSWGPTIDAFRQSPPMSSASPMSDSLLDPHRTPRPPTDALSTHLIPAFFNGTSNVASSTPFCYPFATPLRPSMHTPSGLSTLPRASTIRRTAPRRAVSDREAMRQLLDCIGFSAHKRVLASGRTPRAPLPSSAQGSRGGTMKSLRFVPAPITIEPGMYSFTQRLALNGTVDASDVTLSASASASMSRSISGSSLRWGYAEGEGSATSEDESESSAPPSPSPSPRPGSAMSMLSRRSATPTTATGTWSLRLPQSASLHAGYGWNGRRSSSPALVGGLSLIQDEDSTVTRRFMSFPINDSRKYATGDDGGGVDDGKDASLEAETHAGSVLEMDGLDSLDTRYRDLLADLADIEDRFEAARRRAQTI
ncbi:hypothetical protein EWM64_g7008 [Hericium alpestre]|uniref:Protein kinase domain-containing protein n=1 Tax=Hericium alpestre TaxID=135208 RepID=A0A4Y9ZQZ6_9AGAM|nr:hypothetical protein EWM64_g7008 [Hericium alpestre]